VDISASIQKITDLTERAANVNAVPVLLNIPGQAKHVVHLYNKLMAKLERVELEPEKRDYKATSIQSLIGVINQFAPKATTAGEPDPVPDTDVWAWVNKGTVVVQLHQSGDRRDRVTLALQRSDSFKALETLGKAGQVNQRTLLDYLRTQINCAHTPDLLPLVKRLKFSASTAGDSTVGNGRESMGKRVEAEVAGLDGGSMPEVVEFDVPVYDDLFDEQGYVVKKRIECSFDVNTLEQSFAVKPRAGEIEKALRELDQYLIDQIKFGVASSVRVFRGIPN